MDMVVIIKIATFDRALSWMKGLGNPGANEKWGKTHDQFSVIFVVRQDPSEVFVFPPSHPSLVCL